MQELAVCDAQAAKVHASAPANTNVYIGNLAYIAYSCTPEMCQVLVPLDMGSQPGVR